MYQLIKSVLILVFIFFESGLAHANEQDKAPSSATSKQKVILSFSNSEDHYDKPRLSSKLVNFIYGKPIKDGLIFMPFGIHTKSDSNNVTNNALLGIAYNSFVFGTFMNSFDDRTWYLVKGRNIISYKRFGADYYFGLMYGYKGKLSTSKGIPFRNTFLFKGNLNPAFTIAAHYSISDHVQVQAMLSPLVSLVGVKYNF